MIQGCLLDANEAPAQRGIRFEGGELGYRLMKQRDDKEGYLTID